MDTKLTVVIIVTAVIIGSCGAAAMIMIFGHDWNNGGTDVVRTDLQVGDYAEFRIDSHDKWIWSSDREYSRAEFLDEFYRPDGGEYIGPEQVAYKDVPVECDVYSYYEGSLLIYSGASGFIYRYVDVLPDTRMTYTLSDTNMDPAKAKNEQVVENGSFTVYGYEVNITNATGTYTGVLTTKMDNYNGSAGKLDYTEECEAKIELREEIESISPDGKVKVKGEEEYIEPSYFLSFLSKEQFEKYYKDVKGCTLTWGEGKDAVMHTAFGKRDVTEQTVKVDDGSNDPISYRIYYGEEGVIYSWEMLDDDSLFAKMPLEVTSSSLISKK